MERSALNKYYKNNNHKNQNLYKKQKNYCSRLYKKEKKQFYSNLNHSNITDNNKFWSIYTENYTHKQQGYYKVANTMNEFFSKAVIFLNLTKQSYFLTDTMSNDPISNIIEKYKNHPNIINIKEHITQSNFSFREIILTEISNELININCKKNILPMTIFHQNS